MKVSSKESATIMALATLTHPVVTQKEITCESSKDCDKKSYCAAGTCLEIAQCHTRDDCFNIDNGPYPAVYCVGYMACNDGYCEMNCSGEFCAPGEALVECEEALPCDSQVCEEAVSCHNENCGGCRAIWYDAAGNQVCRNNDDEARDATEDPELSDTDVEATSRPNDISETNATNSPTDKVTTSPTNDNEPAPEIQFQSCASDGDCMQMAVERSITGSFYCGRGFCFEMGQCGSDSDCDNPWNTYAPSFHCVGYNVCENGACGRECGPPCPDEDEEYFDEFCDCAPTSCPGSVSCQIDRCGGCSAIFYDAAGNVMSGCEDGAESAEAFNDNNSLAGVVEIHHHIVISLTAMALLAMQY